MSSGRREIGNAHLMKTRRMKACYPILLLVLERFGPLQLRPTRPARTITPRKTLGKANAYQLLKKLVTGKKN